MTNALPLPDASAREAIAGDLATNCAVEAAAGSGKTTCLVGRLMALFRRGALTGEARLAALTFTHKAASELNERLERELAAALAGDAALAPEERAHLEAARAALPECHIGTIHSFCSRLIRERPVEAGVGPDFRELEDEDDRRLRRRAWDQFALRLEQGEFPELKDIFERHRLDRDTLFQGFAAFAEYPDIEEWPGANPGKIDAAAKAAFLKGVRAYRQRLEPFRAALAEVEAGNDKLLPILRNLGPRLSRLPDHPGAEAVLQLAGLFKKSPETVQSRWTPLGLDKTGVKEEIDAYNRFYDETVAPFRRVCLGTVYAAALQAFELARKLYDEARLAARRLNFQDLLLTTARLLREHPGVRADLADRYRLLLVDEVQDTDPVQAEIMFLLASDDAREKDWRRCRPRPGALFMVGDPKQSIYRFRRADIVVYQEMKSLLADAGGKLLSLSVNFRSQPAILDWINQTFGPATSADATGADETDPDASPEAAGRFPAVESAFSPAYVPMRPGLPPAEEECFTGVYRLDMIAEKRKAGEEAVSRGDVFSDEAERIARFIRHAVDAKMLLPSRNGPRPARPEDFLIIAYNKAKTGIYAAAVRALGLPCRVSGGASLKDSPALNLLLSYLRALAEPDNGVRLLAVLRGGLFGVSDVELYRWKKAGGRFAFPMAGIHAAAASASPAVAAAFEQLTRHHALFRRMNPATALETAATDLGLWPLACLGDDPDGGAGRLAAALELLRAEAWALATPGALAERLEQLLDEHEEDVPPARERSESAVRVMNLHKTKGLEAPVVFLTCTKGRQGGKPVRFAARRGDGVSQAAMSLVGGMYDSELLAQPEHWEQLAEEEARFLAAEAIRLNYVAASRAGAALVISVHGSGKARKSDFLPGGGAGAHLDTPLPEPDPATVRSVGDDALSRIDAEALADRAEERERRRTVLLAASRGASRVTPEAADSVSGGENAMAMGEVLHRLLALPATSAELARTAETLLREYGLPPGRAREAAGVTLAARDSEIWRRAEKAEKVLREVPYVTRREDAAGGGIERGVVDLAFREAGGWVLVDFKSDRLPSGADPHEAAAAHAPQLAAYARAWREVTGEGVVEVGIYYLRSGEYVTV